MCRVTAGSGQLFVNYLPAWCVHVGCPAPPSHSPPPNFLPHSASPTPLIRLKSPHLFFDSTIMCFLSQLFANYLPVWCVHVGCLAPPSCSPPPNFLPHSASPTLLIRLKSPQVGRKYPAEVGPPCYDGVGGYLHPPSFRRFGHATGPLRSR